MTNENALTGTTEWHLQRPSDTAGRQVLGYARQDSVIAGETVEICASAAPSQVVEAKVYRMGWYGGTRGRLVADLGSRTVSTQTVGTLSAVTGELACSWPVTWSVPVSSSWLSGIYVVRLVSAAGFDTHVTGLWGARHAMFPPRGGQT